MTSPLARVTTVTACAVLLSAALVGAGKPPERPAIPSAVPAFRSAVNASALPPDVLARLKDSPHAYFRFVNKPWTQAVCDEFRKDLPKLPKVRLHGDAHVEQYAVTDDSRGLDDFDDSALGPAVVDVVRFLGSLDLVARQKGWQDQRHALFDAFFRGYERALQAPSYLPHEPAVVERIRARPTRSTEEFLAWAESLMGQGSPEFMEALERGMGRFNQNALEQVPGATEQSLWVKKFGVLHMGIGSALTRKVLLRVEGPTAAPEDDVIIEAKELARLDSASCVSIPPPVEAFRVVTAASQLGRLHHELMVVVPNSLPGRADSPGWWVRSWDRTYKELEIADIKTPRDLEEVAEDAGAQLGSANTRHGSNVSSDAVRKRELASVRKLAPRIRGTAERLAADVVAAWDALRAAPTAQ